MLESLQWDTLGEEQEPSDNDEPDDSHEIESEEDDVADLLEMYGKKKKGKRKPLPSQPSASATTLSWGAIASQTTKDNRVTEDADDNDLGQLKPSSKSSKQPKWDALEEDEDHHDSETVDSDEDNEDIDLEELLGAQPQKNKRKNGRNQPKAAKPSKKPKCEEDDDDAGDIDDDDDENDDTDSHDWEELLGNLPKKHKLKKGMNKLKAVKPSKKPNWEEEEDDDDDSALDFDKEDDESDEDDDMDDIDVEDLRGNPKRNKQKKGKSKPKATKPSKKPTWGVEEDDDDDDDDSSDNHGDIDVAVKVSNGSKKNKDKKNKRQANKLSQAPSRVSRDEEDDDKANSVNFDLEDELIGSSSESMKLGRPKSKRARLRNAPLSKSQDDGEEDEEEDDNVEDDVDIDELLSEVSQKKKKSSQKQHRLLNRVEPVDTEDSDDKKDDTLGKLQLSREEADETQVVDSDEKPNLPDKVKRERFSPRKRRSLTQQQPKHVTLRLDDVGYTVHNEEILKGVSWGVQTGERIGLVGRNGAGKTTQLRIMAGELEPSSGSVVESPSNIKTALLRQEFVDMLDESRTLREELMDAFEEMDVFRKIKEVEHAIQEQRDGEEEDEDDIDVRQQKLSDKLDQLKLESEEIDLGFLELQVLKMLPLLGFDQEEFNALVGSFSGGWKMRIALGKVLLRQPNVLLLDEPTNHLDLDSVEWLEEFLQQQKIPMVIVTHDREFVDRVCTKIVDIDGGECNSYTGDYSKFLRDKKKRLESWRSSFETQEKKIRAERQWINKFRNKKPEAAKQRLAKLEKFVKSEDYIKRPPNDRPFTFRFPDPPRSSGLVAEVARMSHAYKSQTSVNRLFDNVDLDIRDGDRIAIVGPNGSGKSTLLRLLVGNETPNEGMAKIVGANVVPCYFEQNQADVLNLDKTVEECVLGISKEWSYTELRTLLGRFMFSNYAVKKRVRDLSGGEKARLSLCRMMLSSSNLLVLDEPTNHLDIPAKEMLEEALQHFPGTIIIVSHDRYFISQVATTIVAIEDKKLVTYNGDYKSFLERKNKMKERIEARYVKGVPKIESAPERK
eukprot:Nitzschia sp. Nitz4//scaffold124_size66437//1956//5721//NITZ4_006100-RA/size66437-augustus-gene-0.0-mRNA-1//1//CDS//3329534519//2919//frame0